MINNERIDMEIVGIDWSQFDLEKELRRLNEEQREEKLEQIVIIKEMQKKLNESKNILEIIKKQKEEERRKVEKRREREEENDRLCRESYQRNEKEREKREKQKRVDEEWETIEKMRIKDKRRAEKEWRRQEIQKRRREENRQRAMEERKCFGCGGFGYIAHHCRNMEEEGAVQMPSNKFEMLKSRVMQRGEGSGREIIKDRSEILREERAKRGVKVKQTKVEREEKKKEVFKRSNGKDWVKTGRRKRGNCDRCVVR